MPAEVDIDRGVGLSNAAVAAGVAPNGATCRSELARDLARRGSIPSDAACRKAPQFQFDDCCAADHEQAHPFRFRPKSPVFIALSDHSVVQ